MMLGPSVQPLGPSGGDWGWPSRQTGPGGSRDADASTEARTQAAQLALCLGLGALDCLPSAQLLAPHRQGSQLSSAAPQHPRPLSLGEQLGEVVTALALASQGAGQASGSPGMGAAAAAALRTQTAHSPPPQHHLALAASHAQAAAPEARSSSMAQPQQLPCQPQPQPPPVPAPAAARHPSPDISSSCNEPPPSASTSTSRTSTSARARSGGKRRRDGGSVTISGPALPGPVLSEELAAKLARLASSSPGDVRPTGDSPAPPAWHEAQQPGAGHVPGAQQQQQQCQLALLSCLDDAIRCGQQASWRGKPAAASGLNVAPGAGGIPRPSPEQLDWAARVYTSHYYLRQGLGSSAPPLPANALAILVAQLMAAHGVRRPR